MLNKKEDAIEYRDNSILRHQIRFDYPFHKVDMMLFKKAVEDFVLINPCKVNACEENNLR
jgi:hypothetical protein